MVEEWRRLRDFGLALHRERQNVARDLERLGAKFHSASENFAKATKYLQDLATIRQSLELDRDACEGARQRALELKLWEIDDLALTHGRKRSLYLRATLRIYGVLRMNESFQELLNELAVHVQSTLRAGLDVIRCLSRGHQVDRHLWAEFQQAANRLAHPHKIYQELQR